MKKSREVNALVKELSEGCDKFCIIYNNDGQHVIYNNSFDLETLGNFIQTLQSLYNEQIRRKENLPRSY